MPLTAEQAVKQIYDSIAAQGKFNIGNSLDAIIGVAVTDTPQLQAFLNDLLKKKGVLSASDEKVLNDLLAQQAAEKKKRQQIRIKNGIIIGLIAAAVGGIIYFSFKGYNKKK